MRLMILVVFILSLLCLVVLLDSDDCVRSADETLRSTPTRTAAPPAGARIELPDRRAEELEVRGRTLGALEKKVNRSVRRLRS